MDNLAGWTEGTQWRSYPREGTFDPGFLRSVFDLIYGKQGDPNWDYDYMKRGYDVWYKMTDVWRDKTRAYVPRAVLKTVPNPEKLKKKKSTTAVSEHITLPRENPPPYVPPSNWRAFRKLCLHPSRFQRNLAKTKKNKKNKRNTQNYLSLTSYK